MQSLKENYVLEKMLDRLFAALVNGPSLNARPHSSRQRIDFTQLAKLKDVPLEQVLQDLLGEKREAKIIARVQPVRKRPQEIAAAEANKVESAEEKAAKQAYAEQQAVLSKCRGIVEDAKVYENDTGVHVLQIGFPILSLPPGSFGSKSFTRRVLAPVCLISLSMSVKAGANPSIVLECRNDGADLIQPNVALLAWLENQAGREVGDLDGDETGERPWHEIADIVSRVCKILEMDLPPEFSSGETCETSLQLRSCPRADDEDAKAKLISSAVVGLFPLANQGLIRDTQAMLAGEPVSGPIEHFVNLGAQLDNPDAIMTEERLQPVEKLRRDFANERLVASADPCQSRAVRFARHSKGLVVHGPPGTGKSQTISNIIGDHLARGERVLFVCDKRTALDVVMNRLEGMGLSALCAIVHDPQRDQRELYKAIREQLDNLPELRTNAGAETQIGRLDSEFQKIHNTLSDYHTALMEKPNPDRSSFHELIGQWLNLPSHSVEFKEETLSGISPTQLESHIQRLHELFERGIACEYPNNPWSVAVGMPLADFLSIPMDKVRAALQTCVENGKKLDQSNHDSIPAFQADDDVVETGSARAAFAERLKRAAGNIEHLKKWASTEPGTLRKRADQIADLTKHVEVIEQARIESELLASLGPELPSIASLNQQALALDGYLKATKGIFGFLAFGKRKAATQILTVYGLMLSREEATRVRDFLTALKTRLLVQECLNQLEDKTQVRHLTSDEMLISSIRLHRELFATLLDLEASQLLKSLRDRLVSAVQSPDMIKQFTLGLELSAIRGKAIADFEAAVENAKLFSSHWVTAFRQHVRNGEQVSEPLGALHDKLATLENVLRAKEGLSKLPDALRCSSEQLLKHSVSPDVGLTVLRKSALVLEITSLLRSDSRLQSADRYSLQASFDRYLSLHDQKQKTARELLMHVWGAKQKSKLLAGTGSRLNGAGADLRRRFVLRGERAMRLRQVIAVGQSLPNEDPLFDLRPIWMASPETVAQIFPRKAIFDVVVFDEASQCRLEEAMPVLLRGKRVVIAGDPKQLPPTRFFESTIAASDQDEIETEQQLFEVQQGEIEDLLGAALNIEIEECYLDVHYRSRNSDLIEFSNEHFYGSRLQPIPGHPSNRTRYAPLTLYKANGVYKDRQNELEAEKVCHIVRDLLRRAEPPSIGIACFNINQRDVILDKLDEYAESDPTFARALSNAWTRRTNGQFEGLFVKNLENVQGDERDHIIISTTYGPDATGKFARRFGPLGRVGGGRRLNVLVTRARDEVHLVTSIPEYEYRQLPPIPLGQTPGGGWLLFSYLAYAERLAELYEEAHRVLADAQAEHRPILNVGTTKYPSEFCRGLGQQLVENHHTGTDVYWGNDGFCVDLALRHPRHVEDVTIGVLCDTNRFGLAADPVEWEIFRTLILESQGWKLHRLWTPHFFRDGRGNVENILAEMNSFLASETEKNVIRVNNSGEMPK